MRCLKTALAFCTAIIITMLCVGCADSSTSSSAGSNSSSLSSDSSQKGDDSSADSTAGDTDSSSEAENQTNSSTMGEGIMQAYNFLQNTSYSMNIRFTDSEGNVTEVYRVVDGDNFYQRQKNEIGESGSIRVGDECYDYDNVCGIYRKSSEEKLDSVVETVVDEQLPRTYTHINEEDEQSYDVEEYTYTGDTYITVMDFCFDKQTGELVKYTTTYTVEGSDDITEVREFYNLIPSAPVREDSSSQSDSNSSSDISSETSSQSETESSLADSSEGSDEIEEQIDTSVFNTDFIQNLADFVNMTEERRLGYCQAIFMTAGVTADELSEADIDDSVLKTISYDDFVSLVYTYGYNDSY